EMARFFMKKALATEVAYNDIAAVRHNLPHMPSLGVSSLDSRPPWRHGGLLFCQLLCGWLTMAKFQRKAGQGICQKSSAGAGSRLASVSTGERRPSDARAHARR